MAGKIEVVTIVGLLVVGGLLKNAYGTVGISVTPPILDVGVPPGASKAFTVDVRNMGDVTLVVSPKVMDLELSEEGVPLAVKAGTTKYSCAGWISIDTTEFTLSPGEALRRSFKLTVPPGETGGKYAIVVFDAQPLQAELKQPHLTVATRTGTIVMETIPRRLARSGEIIGVTAKVTSDSVKIEAIFQNTGDVHLKIKPSCVIKDTAGAIVDRVKMDAGTGTVLPSGKRLIRGAWANKLRIKPGKYIAEISVEFRGAKRATGRTEFEIKPRALRGQNPVPLDRSIICMEAYNLMDERR